MEIHCHSAHYFVSISSEIVQMDMLQAGNRTKEDIYASHVYLICSWVFRHLFATQDQYMM